VYGDSKAEGQIFGDDVSAAGNLKVTMPSAEFLAVEGSSTEYSGIMGLAPKDESAGPLMVD